MHKHRSLAALLLMLVVTAAAIRVAGARSDAPEPVEFSPRELKRIRRLSSLGPVPVDPTNRAADDPAARHLGRFLFFDTGLSSTGNVSCATCHDPTKGFSDGLSLAKGVAQLERHSPALWNVAYQRWFFWDGRADTLWSQALQPIEDPREMASSRAQVAHRIHDDHALREAYQKIFGPLPDLGDRTRFPECARPVPGNLEHPHNVAWSAMSETDRKVVNTIFVNVAKCIAAYERQLVIRNAPFDEFVTDLVAGRPSTAISPSAQRGLKIFIGRGNCRVCHNGPNLTDEEFHNTGVPPLSGGFLEDAGRYKGAELLRRDPFNSLGAFSDARDGATAQRLRTLLNSSEQWGAFKTPGLRNVALTAPYMHQGQFATLEDVLRFYSTLEEQTGMGHHQETILVALGLGDGELADLVHFLEALTDNSLDPELLRAPGSPCDR